jgi:hypothetical protein
VGVYDSEIWVRVDREKGKLREVPGKYWPGEIIGYTKNRKEYNLLHSVVLT